LSFNSPKSTQGPRCTFKTQQKKFDAIWKKLDELRKKAPEEIAKRLVNPEHEEEPISLEDVGLDGPQVKRRRGRAVKTFS
jgi:hypothetical protein